MLAGFGHDVCSVLFLGYKGKAFYEPQITLWLISDPQTALWLTKAKVWAAKLFVFHHRLKKPFSLQRCLPAR